jgi:methionyl-tRNA formyltransferase
MIYKKSKILFIGTVEFSYRALSALIENKFDIVGVLTKRESNFNSDYYDLTPLAKANNIPIFYRTKDNQDEIISFINSKNPDIIYCFGWSHILPKNILSIPKHGVIGFHPAELPNNKGRHPIIWALFLGLKQTASTFFVMDEGADTGDIISQEKIKIIEDNAFSLYNKIINVALKQIVSFSLELETKGAFLDKIKQDKTEGNSWRKRTKNDGKIDFRMTSRAILNLVNALSRPYVGAHIEFQEEEVKVWEVKEEEKINKLNHEPGKVLEIDGSDLIVKTYDGSIRIIDHEFNHLPLKGQYL